VHGALCAALLLAGVERNVAWGVIKRCSLHYDSLFLRPTTAFMLPLGLPGAGSKLEWRSGSRTNRGLRKNSWVPKVAIPVK
jgi:hypothetical protein